MRSSTKSPWTTKPQTPNEVSLEDGTGFEAAMAALVSDQKRLKTMMQKRGMLGILNHLRKREVAYRTMMANLLARGVDAVDAVEQALANLVPEPSPEDQNPIPGHEPRISQLHRYVQSAPRTWPTEITVSARRT